MRSLSDWLSWQETLHPNPIDLGLTRLNKALVRLQWRRPTCPVITVAGTNGKGSSVALLNRILTMAGYRVGTFTSPHLLRYNERITVADVEVSDESLVTAFERIDCARGANTLTFFEFNALAALLIFETACLDVIVLEVGLGGRLDAVNAVDCDVALVTSIALDHCDWLGTDLNQIGREKAGIFRANRPAIFGSREMPQSIADVAQQTGAPLLRLGVDFDHRRTGDTWSWRGNANAAGQAFDHLPMPALVGDIQFDNAAAVIAVLSQLQPRLPVTLDAIRRGLASVALRGRFQRVLVNAVPWMLDVAHNPAAARTLAAQLSADREVRGATIAVCAILGDKDIDGVTRELVGCFDRWIIAGLPGARALSAPALASRIEQGGGTVVAIEATVALACERARATATPSDRVVVFGSFLTVGAALEWLPSRGVTI